MLKVQLEMKVSITFFSQFAQASECFNRKLKIMASCISTKLKTKRQKRSKRKYNNKKNFMLCSHNLNIVCRLYQPINLKEIPLKEHFLDCVLSTQPAFCIKGIRKRSRKQIRYPKSPHSVWQVLPGRNGIWRKIKVQDMISFQ